MIYRREEAAREAAMQTAQKMVAAALTAPKGHGCDNVDAIILDGEEKDTLANYMREIGYETKTGFFIRDAANVDNSHCVVVIGVKDEPILLDHCGFCGHGDCGGNREAGASCAFNITDLGIAIGSAVSVAADNRIDNRVLFSGGKAALRMKCFGDDVKVCFAIPLSTTSKSVFFDRDPVEDPE